MVSSLSTFSMVMGLASCVLLVLVVPAFATAILAVLFGHIATRHIRSNRAELLGIGRARIGLVLGYSCIVMAGCLFPQMDQGRLMIKGILASDRSAPVEDLGAFSDGVLGTYERKIFGDREPTGGNGPVASDLASSFRRALKAVLAEVLELENRKGLAWDPSGVSCNCYVNQGIVFMVREPDLAGFNDAALEMLNQVAWRVASKTVSESGEFEVGYPVAICIVGKRRSQTFIMGEATNVDEPLQQPIYTGPDSAEVLPLFR